MADFKFVTERPKNTTPLRNRRYEERAPLREALASGAVKDNFIVVEWGSKNDPRSASGRRAALRAAANDVGLIIEFFRWGPSFKNRSIVKIVGRLAS